MKKVKLVPVTPELSAAPEQVKAAIDYTVDRWNMLKAFSCYDDCPDTDPGKHLLETTRSEWFGARKVLEKLGLDDAYLNALRTAQKEGDK